MKELLYAKSLPGVPAPAPVQCGASLGELKCQRVGTDHKKHVDELHNGVIAVWQTVDA